METTQYRILLYYKYVWIEDPTAFADEHRQICTDLGLRGRIIVAGEGLNGTVSGTVDQTDAYMAALRRDPRFADMAFKIDEYHRHAFKKLIVRVKDETVPMKLEQDINPTVVTGQYLEPKAFRELMASDDVVIIDGRNDYEYDIGHFKGAIRPAVKTFREFPDWIRSNLSSYKDKTVLTYCTGGIRCEKLSGFLIREGFKQVYQLDGGIVSYGKDPDVRGQGFEGKCYVFDERIAVPINQDEDIVVGNCYHCQVHEDRYINCAHPQCHKQHICCEPCETAHNGYCSCDCQRRHAESLAGIR